MSDCIAIYCDRKASEKEIIFVQLFPLCRAPRVGDTLRYNKFLPKNIYLQSLYAFAANKVIKLFYLLKCGPAVWLHAMNYDAPIVSFNRGFKLIIICFFFARTNFLIFFCNKKDFIKCAYNARIILDKSFSEVTKLKFINFFHKLLQIMNKFYV